MISAMVRKSFLLSSFSLVLVSCLTAYAEVGDQSDSGTIDNRNKPWIIDKYRQPAGFLYANGVGTAVKHTKIVRFSKDNKYSSQILSAPRTFDLFDVSICVIEANEIEPPRSFPPFPTTIELPTKVDVSGNPKRFHSLYIPGDTKDGNDNFKSSWAATEGSTRDHYDKAIQLGLLGKWPEAIKEHETALKADPRNYTYLTNLSSAELQFAEKLEKSGNLAEAVNHYRHAIYADRLNLSADMELDKCLERLGIDHADPKICRELAEKFALDGDLEAAIVEYYKLVELADTGRVHAALGMLLVKANKIVDGYSELKIAVARADWKPNEDKQLAQCHRQLADLLSEYSNRAMDSGRKATALQRLLNSWIEYKRAVFLDPTDRQSAKQLLLLSNEALNISPTYDNWLAAGSASILNDDLDRAAESYEMCEKLDPNNPLSLKAKAALDSARKTIKIRAGQMTVPIVGDSQLSRSES